MLVEPESLCWLTGRMVQARDGITWAEEFARFPGLVTVIRDDGTGLGKGLKLERARRRAAGQPGLDDTLDVFHTLREGGRALRATWAEASRALEAAEAAQRRFERRCRQRQSNSGHGAPLNRSWARAERAFARAEAAETAWHRARAALELFTPEGRLNDRGPTPAAAATRAWALARTLQLEKTSDRWRAWAKQVSGVLRGVWRASSLVECVNSVARMQQSRHRTMTQGLLDLKRLYWNLRRFRIGRRKGQAPYGLLGLALPELSFWEFLKLTPDELRQQLSAMNDTS